MKPIVLIGGGGHCESVIDTIESTGRSIKGILDIPSKVGTFCLDVPVIGTDSEIYKYINDCEFIITLGFIKNSKLRNELHRLVEEANGEFATIISSTAHVSKYADIGKGTVVLHYATVNAGARIGKGCIINTHANVEHDAVIGDFCHVSTGAMVNGGCTIGNSSFIGSGSVLRNGINIGRGCVIGAGSVVTKDLPQGELWIGNPARYKSLV